MSARPQFAVVRPLEMLFNFSVRQAESGVDVPASRDAWTSRCALRLRELRPDADMAAVASLVDDMWLDVAGMNPEIAAEMEHESWQVEH